MMKRFIGLIGANATGKSTRMKVYVQSLEDAGVPFEEWTYTFEKHDKMITTVVGRFYQIDNLGKLLIIGKPKRDGGWVGGDHTLGKLGSIDCVETFLRAAEKEGVDTVICESYFANSSTMLHPSRLFNFFDSVNNHWMYYDADKIEEYISRCNNRSGKEERGLEWATDSAGWRQNLQFIRTCRRTQDQVSGHKGSSVDRVCHYSPEDWLVGRMTEFNN